MIDHIFQRIIHSIIRQQIQSINPTYMKDYRISSRGSRLSYLIDSLDLHVVLVGTGTPVVMSFTFIS